MDIMRCLIYCHGMSVTFDETIGEPVFEGASPDEEATLVAVYCNGFELLPKGVNREITEWKNHHTGLKNSGSALTRELPSELPQLVFSSIKAVFCD